MKFYTGHQPQIRLSTKIPNFLVYEKVETNDDFYHIKTNSISIAAKVLEKVDGVKIIILHRNVIVYATKKEIKDQGSVLTFKGETKYYLKVSKWKVGVGKKTWYRDLRKKK